jgi:hypothetical protein
MHTYVVNQKDKEKIKEMNEKVAAQGYYKIDEDVHISNREFEVGNSHLKVEQTYDERPGPVKHIKPEDYDGPQRSRRLEAYHNSKNKKQFIKESRKESNKRMSQIEAACRAVVEHPLAANNGVVYHGGQAMLLPQVI